MKAMLLSRDPELLAQATAMGAARTPPLAFVPVQTGLAGAAAALAGESPRLAVLDAATARPADIAQLDRLVAEHPETSFLLLAADQSPETLLAAMRAGVREVLPLPLGRDAFDEALARMLQKLEASVRNGKVVSFVPCKGGSGATFLAANFGHVLAREASRRVLLIDLNRQFGDAALYVSEKKPATTLADVCAQINRIDLAFLESSLIAVSPNFGVLAASEDPTHGADITPAHIDTILRLARSYYDFVILDTGRQIDAVTIRAFDQSDIIYPVLQLSMPHLRDAGRLLDIFDSLGYDRTKSCLIVNRHEKGGELNLADLQAALGEVRVQTMPNNYRPVAESINHGVPVLQMARNSPICKSLVRMTDEFAGRKAAPEAGFLMKLFQGRVQASVAHG